MLKTAKRISLNNEFIRTQIALAAMTVVPHVVGRTYFF